MVPYSVLKTRKDCNERLLISEPHNHSRNRVGSCAVYGGKYHQVSSSSKASVQQTGNKNIRDNDAYQKMWKAVKTEKEEVLST